MDLLCSSHSEPEDPRIQEQYGTMFHSAVVKYRRVRLLAEYKLFLLCSKQIQVAVGGAALFRWWMDESIPRDPFCDTIDETVAIFQSKAIFQVITSPLLQPVHNINWMHSFFLWLLLLCTQLWVSFFVKITASWRMNSRATACNWSLNVSHRCSGIESRHCWVCLTRLWAVTRKWNCNTESKRGGRSSLQFSPLHKNMTIKGLFSCSVGREMLKKYFLYNWNP